MLTTTFWSIEVNLTFDSDSNFGQDVAVFFVASFLWYLCCYDCMSTRGMTVLSGDGLAITSARTDHHRFHTLCTTTYTEILLCRSCWGRFQCPSLADQKDLFQMGSHRWHTTSTRKKKSAVQRGKWEKEGVRMDLGFCSYTADGVGQCIFCQSNLPVSTSTNNAIIKPSHSIGFRHIGREKQTLVGWTVEGKGKIDISPSICKVALAIQWKGKIDVSPSNYKPNMSNTTKTAGKLKNFIYFGLKA